jgi:hypothetical protein
MRRTALLLLLTPILAATAGPRPAPAQPQPGDLAVVDIQAGTNQRGAVFLVNPVTGMRRVLSDLGNASQGPIAVQAYSIAIGPGGDFFVVDRRGGTNCGFGSGCGALLRVDRVTGARTLVSDFGVEQAPNPPPDTGLSPFDIALEDGGQFLVTDPSARFVPNQDLAGVLFRVDPGTGARTAVSDFTNQAQGPLGARPSGVAVSGGHALVTDPFLGLLFRVDRGTGARTVLSNFTDPAQGPTAPFPAPIAATADINNQVLVVDQFGEFQDGIGLLWSVDAGNGTRTIVSDFRTAAQGPLAFNLSSVKLDADNRILVLDFDSGTNFFGALYHVDRATGQRDCVSDFGSAAQGPLGREPSGLAVVPGARPPGLSLAAAVLPASRSVQVGQTATAFVSIINTGASVAKAVGIPLQGCTIPATITYQTTNPLTNALTGTVNTPVDIPAGATQTFVVAITPTAPFAPADAAFAFGGDNTAAVARVVGLNTLLLSGSAAPVPDVVALGATINNNGIVDVLGANGTGFFSVATANVGASAAITASVDTGSAVLPLNIQICQTNPATGECTSALGPTVDTSIGAFATPTFAVFVTAQGPVPFDPALNRIFVRFKDAGGVTRGATSVAVRTQ